MASPRKNQVSVKGHAALASLLIDPRYTFAGGNGSTCPNLPVDDATVALLQMRNEGRIFELAPELAPLANLEWSTMRIAERQLHFKRKTCCHITAYQVYDVVVASR